MKVSEVINQALALSHPYVDASRAPTGYLIELLKVLDEEVLSYYASAEPERVALKSQFSVTVSLSSNAAGYTLPAPPPGVLVQTLNGEPVFSAFGGTVMVSTDSGATYVPAPPAIGFFGFTLTQDTSVFTISLVPEILKNDPPRHPAAFIRGNVIVPCDPLYKDWATSYGERSVFKTGSKINFSYVPRPMPLSKTTDSLLSPEDARAYIVNSLSMFMLLGAQGVPAEVIQNSLLRVREARNVIFNMMDRRSHSIVANPVR